MDEEDRSERGISGLESLASSLIELIGPAMALISAAAIAIITWCLSHFNSQPGTQISIFWGLVTYTKRFRDLGNQAVEIKDVMSGKESVYEESKIWE